MSKKKKDELPGEKLIVKNKKAFFNFAIEERYEGGLVLLGSEVKSLRAGAVEMVDAFAGVEKGEMWLKQLNIAPFAQARAFPHDPRRPRKVLLHSHEIDQIGKRIQREGYTLVPLRLYFKDGRVKVELALAKGKNVIDKRQDIAKKTAAREARSVAGRRIKGGDR
jgi:SsrA-binding protein